jgi:hypothetical protein
MALLLKSGDVFLHIPKTGGNWVTKVLYEQDLVAYSLGHKHSDVDRTFYLNRHCNLSFLRYHAARSLGWVKKDPFIFCMVRHPLRWYESWFKYMSQPKNEWRSWGNRKFIGGWHPNFELNGCDHQDFPAFLQWILEYQPGYVGNMFSRYTYKDVDYIGKQENLATDLVAILDHTGLQYDREVVLQRAPVGVSKYKEKKLEWPASLREQVLKTEYSAMLRYKYILP